MARQETSFTLTSGKRSVTIKVTDSISPEDAYEVCLKMVAHRVVTGEDTYMPVSREVKEALIKTNLNI